MEGPQRHGPELASMAATVEDLRRRVTAIAEAAAATPDDRVSDPQLRSGTPPALRSGTPGTLSLATELFEVERALEQAARRLAKLTDALRRTGP